jgi:hypothetical protein
MSEGHSRPALGSEGAFRAREKEKPKWRKTSSPALGGAAEEQEPELNELDTEVFVGLGKRPDSNTGARAVPHC